MVSLFRQQQQPRLVGPDGTHLSLPNELYEVLRDIVDALARGSAITVVPRETTLTTQEAADLLGISRPTLVSLLDRGEIPFARPGHHRRLKLDDVLDYRRRTQHARHDALDEMIEEAERDELYRDEVVRTRLRR